MKKISNFTQTYQGTLKWSAGSDCKNRDFLIDAFCKDENKIKAYSLLDMPTFNFHNMELEKAKSLATKLKTVLPNLKCTCYNETTMGDCIYRHMIFLKEQGMTDFLWVQDDEFFTYSNFEDFKAVIEHYRNTPDLHNLNLLYPVSEFPDLENKSKVSLIENTAVKLYTTDAKTIAEYRPYVMDFTAFICSIDYFLENMFDPIFAYYRDAYRLEGDCMQKSRRNNIQRTFANVKFFESFNIVGMGGSLERADEALEKLNRLYLNK